MGPRMSRALDLIWIYSGVRRLDAGKDWSEDGSAGPCERSRDMMGSIGCTDLRFAIGIWI